MAHPIEGIMGVSMEKIREMVDVNTIIGEPITAEGTTIIPVSKVSFGFASGGSDLPTAVSEKFAGGSGAGVTVKPVAFIIIKEDGDVELKELGGKTSPVEGVMDALPGLIDKLKGMKKPDKTEE
ncbi:MAG: sporulation protein YtfJ [Ruminococcaceae bacterium]|nr:sporulation protein YtfJ [Oscillospiraceae bacterium]